MTAQRDPQPSDALQACQDTGGTAVQQDAAAGDLPEGPSRGETAAGPAGVMQQGDVRRQPLSALDENLIRQPSKGGKGEQEAGARARKRQRSLSAAAAAPVRPKMAALEDSDDDFV